MDRNIEEKIFMVTYGKTTGNAKFYSKEYVVTAYSVCLFGLALLFSFVLLRDRDSNALGFVLIMLCIMLPLLYLSYRGGRNAAKEYIEHNKDKLMRENVKK